MDETSTINCVPAATPAEDKTIVTLAILTGDESILYEQVIVDNPVTGVQVGVDTIVLL